MAADSLRFKGIILKVAPFVRVICFIAVLTFWVDSSRLVPTPKDRLTAVWPGYVEELMSSSPSRERKRCSKGLVSFISVSSAVVSGAVAFTTTTGKVMSGNKAYLRELNANSPATTTAIQKLSVSQGY